MKCWTGFAGFLAMSVLVSQMHAADKAATSQLPPVLQAMGKTNADLLSQAEASNVRGTSCGASSLGQVKQFAIAGTATGTVTLLEGMFGNVKYTDSSGMVVEGTFGGLEGHLGQSDGGFGFSLQGKAFQETFEFAGQYIQEFAQQYQAGY